MTFYVLNSASQMGVSFWLSDWSTNYDTKMSEKLMRFGVYVALGFSQCKFMKNLEEKLRLIFFKGLFVLIADIIFVGMFTRASLHFHNSLLESILRTKMQFFDTTPVGRIINRFSKDLEATENKIPESYKSVIRCVLVLLSAIVIISISTPLFLLTFVPLSILYFYIQVPLLAVSSIQDLTFLFFNLVVKTIETTRVNKPITNIFTFWRNINWCRDHSQLFS